MSKYKVGDKVRIDEPDGGHKSPWVDGMRAFLSEGTEVEVINVLVRPTHYCYEVLDTVAYPCQDVGFYVHETSLAPSDS